MALATKQLAVALSAFTVAVVNLVIAVVVAALVAYIVGSVAKKGLKSFLNSRSTGLIKQALVDSEKKLLEKLDVVRGNIVGATSETVEEAILLKTKRLGEIRKMIEVADPVEHERLKATVERVRVDVLANGKELSVNAMLA